MEQEGAKTHIRALVPLAELDMYATTLRSLTQGRAYHSRKHAGYEEVPPHISQKIVDEAKKQKEEVHA
jgi:elongation factor G